MTELFSAAFTTVSVMLLRLQIILLLQPELHGHMDLVSHSLQILLSRVSVNPYFFYDGRHTCMYCICPFLMYTFSVGEY